MTQHVPSGIGRVVHEYVADTLGAPFGVVLIDSAIVTVVGGEEIVKIPDFNGLVGAVVRSRVLHPQKLSGNEIRFLRDALSVKAKGLADFLDLSPEHLSRCEAGARLLSPSNEKTLRLFAYMASFFEEPEDLLNQSIASAEPKKPSKIDKATVDFVKMFFSMKIQSVFDPNAPLCFEFVRRGRAIGNDEPDDPGFEYELKDCLAAAA